MSQVTGTFADALEEALYTHGWRGGAWVNIDPQREKPLIVDLRPKAEDSPLAAKSYARWQRLQASDLGLQVKPGFLEPGVWSLKPWATAN
jgi:hypothetical protein